ncbi:MAG: phage portal protein [Bacteroidetes bacterium]|nr:phage portal protein [Bacteroidota bacterium]
MENIRSIWDLEEYKKYHTTFLRRVQELERRRAYYTGSVYETVKLSESYQPEIYKGIKSLYLPLSFAVDVDAGIIPSGWKMDTEKVTEEQLSAFEIVKIASEFITKSVLFVHYGAMFGISGLKIVIENGQLPFLSAIDPREFILIKDSLYAKSPDMSIFVTTDNENREIAEVITRTEVKNFVDGKLMSLNSKPEIYENEFGFIPYVEILHIETGETLGECTFQKVIPILDEVNKLATFLVKIIKRHAEPKGHLISEDLTEVPNFDNSGDDIVVIPDLDAKLQFVAPTMDVQGILNTVKEFSKSIDDGLPETIFNKISDSSNVSQDTVAKKATPLTIKIQRCRPNYDAGLVRALRLIGRAAEVLGISELKSLSKLHDEAFDAHREIIPLSDMERINLELAKLGLEREKAIMQS